MAKSHKIEIYNYTKDNFLSLFGSRNQQLLYLERYLSMLNTTVIIKEPKYFDRDYLAEFAAFYSVSSKGYPNICERLHFFCDDIKRRTLTSASGGNNHTLKRLQDSYLGFIVLRPIPAAPLGRTVLKWLPDKFEATTPRVVEPSREYHVHIAGITLSIYGLAWQQQDTGVGACATVSLWTMFHSSAFDDYHAIPTTAEITRDAHKKLSSGTRLFPSKGLNILQIYEAIKERDMVPLIIEGDVKDISGVTVGFSKDRFASTCASFIRSAYPVLIIGNLVSNNNRYHHAICGVGFRSCIPVPADPDIPDLEDSNVEILYIHDDNLGPNVRFKINLDTNLKWVGDYFPKQPTDAKQITSLVPEPPEEGKIYSEHPTDNYGKFLPTQLIVAAHTEIRTDPDTLHKAAIKHGSDIADLLNLIAELKSLNKFGLTISSRFMKITDYLGKELEDRLNEFPKLLSNVRMELSEKTNPLSLHIGVVRIGLDDATVLVDIIYDTTDSDRNHPIFAHVAYNRLIETVINILDKRGKDQYGICVKAY